MKLLDKNAISLAGEFAVLSQLALRGFDANMTLGHTKGVDILVSDPKKDKMFKIEVKTNYGKKASKSKMFGRYIGWVMGEKHETIVDDNLYYVFVNFEEKTSTPRFFVVPSNIVSGYVTNEHKFWERERENQGKTINNQIPIRVFRIGVDISGYGIKTPLARDYENKWDLLSSK